jgi:hypothetical protein
VQGRASRQEGWKVNRATAKIAYQLIKERDLIEYHCSLTAKASRPQPLKGGVCERPKRNSLSPRRTPVDHKGTGREARACPPKRDRVRKGPTGKGNNGERRSRAFKFSHGQYP